MSSGTFSISRENRCTSWIHSDKWIFRVGIYYTFILQAFTCLYTYFYILELKNKNFLSTSFI